MFFIQILFQFNFMKKQQIHIDQNSIQMDQFIQSQKIKFPIAMELL